MTTQLSDAALNQLFLEARSVHAFKPEKISAEKIHALYDLAKWGPTAFNGQPARYIFIQSQEAKDKLKPALGPTNIPQVESAAVTVIIASDSKFYDHLPEQFPAYDAKPLFESNADIAAAAAFRNSSLQGDDLILAARALGFDSGAMSGFDPQVVNQAFFPDGRYKVNFLLNIGIADPAGVYPRGPRLAFDQVATIL